MASQKNKTNSTEMRKLAKDPDEDPEDHKLFNESYIDIETYSGAVLRAGQKLMLSIKLEKDELFDLENDRFIPILYTFRNANFTDDSVF